MTTIVNTSIEILDKLYPIRCPESEVNILKKAAELLNKKMTEIKESGKVINIERIAIIAALNIAYLFLEIDQQKNVQVSKINQRIIQIQDKLEAAINRSLQIELEHMSE